jgi:PAS domain S-box-containing protein
MNSSYKSSVNANNSDLSPVVPPAAKDDEQAPQFRSPIMRRLLQANTDRPSLWYAKRLVLFTAGYWIAGELGLLVRSGYEGISPLWPPAGLALFAFLLVGRRLWPGVILGSLVLAYIEGISWGSTLVVAGAHVLEAILGSYLLCAPRADFNFSMERIKDVLLLTGYGAIITALIGSITGALTLAVTGLGQWDEIRMLWFTWWLGDVVGIIVVTPLLLVWRQWRQVRMASRELTELTALLAVLGVTAWINFYLIAEHELHIPLALYLMLPFAIWAAARFRQYGATLVAALVCVVMLWGTQHGYGAFAPYSGLDRLLLSIFYIAVTSFTALSVAALFAERLQTEKELSASKEQFRTLVDTMSQGLRLQDKDGIVTYVNDRFCEIVGYSSSEIVHKPVTAHIGDTNQALWLELVNARKLGKTDPYEQEVKRKDGRKVYLEVSPQIIFDDDGKPNGSFAVYTDITRRKQIETILSGRRKVLERLATGAPLKDVLATLAETVEQARSDTRCAVMLVEEGSLRLVVAPSLPGYYVAALHGVEIDAGDGACAATVSTGTRMIVEDVLTHPYWYAYQRLAQRAGVRSCWCEPIVSSRGEVLGAIAMYHNHPRAPDQSDLQSMAATARQAVVAIEQRRKEEALKQSEERFRQLAEHIRDVFWMTEADGTPRYISPAYERVWGRSLQSLYANPSSWIDAIHPDDRESIGQTFFAKVPHEDSEKEYRVILPDGKVRWIRDRAFTIHNELGEVYRVAGIAEDVTEHKLAEQQVREHQDKLAHMARLSSVGEMASSLAHELNQPLGAVTNYCKAGLRLLSSNSPDGQRVATALEKASMQAQRAGDIIHHIRDFTRKDTRRRACIEMNSVVREAVRLTEIDIYKQQGSIRLELSEVLPKVMGDRVQLEQVILNLLRNGMEAMVECQAASRLLVVCSRARDARTVQVSVKDNGLGLGNAALDHIFDPFYTTKCDGMGMGLSISRSIIEAHTGRLWAESLASPERGAVFHFTLPISQECA